MVPRSSGAVVNGRAKMAMYDDVTGDAGLFGVGGRAEGSGRPVWNLCRCLREGGWRFQGGNRQPTRRRNSYYDRRTAEEIPVSPRRSFRSSLANAPLYVAIFLPAGDDQPPSRGPGTGRRERGSRAGLPPRADRISLKFSDGADRGTNEGADEGVVLEYPLPRAICGNVRGPQSDGRRMDRS